MWVIVVLILFVLWRIGFAAYTLHKLDPDMETRVSTLLVAFCIALLLGPIVMWAYGGDDFLDEFI